MAGAALVLAGADLSRMPVLLVSALIPSLFTVIGLVLLVWRARGAWRRRVLGVAVLALPEPLALGSEVTARFQRSGGSRRPRGPARLAADLVCIERASYTQGTDHHTANHEIRRHELAAWADDGAADPVAGRVRITVPLDAPPSMDLRHNKLIWTVRVNVMVAGVPHDTAELPVTVLPVVAPGHDGPAPR